MKRTLALITCCIALVAALQTATAAKVSVTTAQTVAVNFYKANLKVITRGPVSASLQYTHTETDNTIDFYVFNINPGKGFVIVSADDQLIPVIAYSAESDFKLPAKTSNLQCWLNHAGQHIYRAIQHKVTASPAITDQWSAYLLGQKPASAKAAIAVVSPLLSTNWNQEPYYNQLCPYNAVDSQQAVTGCVATAMAQIMKYWNYPAQGTGQYGYADMPPYAFFNYGDQYANFGGTTYNWASMPDILSGPNLPVATLMYQCGVAVAMSYGDDNQGGSGAYVLASDVASWKHTAQMAYTTYFGYNPGTLRGVYEYNYSSADWISLLESEISAGRPVQYVGTDTTEGSHTWVCDGYDANNLLHMNWGWGGYDNGYFNIASLTADGFNFSSREEALIGIEPANNLTATALAANSLICSGSSTMLTAQGGPAGASYSWSPASSLSCATCAVATASPVVTTVYTVTMDSAGLSAIATVTINVNNKINVESMEVTDATCFGSANGTAKVEVSGGTGAYQYLWGNGNDSAAVSGLNAGSYNVTVTDTRSCTASAVAVINQPVALSVSVNAFDNVCSLTDAKLKATAQGGTPSYFFMWDGGQTGDTVSSAVTGNYTVTVNDAAGCTVTASLAVTQPAAMDVNIVYTDTSCSLLYAVATVNVTGGNQNLSYLWSNGQNTPRIVDLSSGSFSVTVTDSLGCSASASQNLTQPDPMSASIVTSEITDKEIYVKAVVNVTGGTPQYSYLWNTGASTPQISNLTPGIYTVTITDNKGCVQTASTQITNLTSGISSYPDTLIFDVYPNPAVNFATLVLNDYQNTTLDIKNLSGQTLLHTAISAEETRLNLSGLANGLYLVSVNRGPTAGIKEIIIQK